MLFGSDPSYHDKQIALAKREGRRLDQIEWVCLTDGRKCVDLDDGPFHAVDMGTGEGAPNNVGRSRILKKLRKRDADGNPLWVSEKKHEPIMDWVLGETREIPVMNDHYRAVMAKHSAFQKQRNAQGAREYETKLKKKAEEQAAFAKAAVQEGLREFVADLNAAKRPAVPNVNRAEK
jgi:hypothetical protein